MNRLASRLLNTPFAALAVLGIFSRLATPAALQGYIRDTRGIAVSGAIVEIQIKAMNHAEETRTALTDGGGSYRFPSLPAGEYTLRAKAKSAREFSLGPFLLAGTELKSVDLVLRPAAASIGFFDEPKFTVAGVSDNAYTGGHGSDTVARSAESLTKATASLSKPVSEVPVPPDRTEQAVREAIEHDRNNAALYHLLANTEERIGKPLEAVHNYERAAALDPSEPNLFDWGTELLLHRAPEAAIEIFSKGIRLFPSSSRMLLGAAVALYMGGDYTQAAQRFFQAIDLNPGDPEPYLFLGKVQTPEIAESDGFRERFERFAKLQPENAWANYYYATCLLKLRKGPGDIETPSEAQSLLEKAVRLDPKLAVAYLQLGIIYSAQQDLPAAIHAYRQAIEAEPGLEQAHYRLAQAYRQTGELKKAQGELALFQELSKTSAQERDRERSELKQFVVTLKGPAPN
ncbi:MAG: tetratricopeptide repeat protein [Acidobacteriota bacterium]|nr:tetratricopeptide repeat protein [Acidobacteriota bacterium]